MAHQPSWRASAASALLVFIALFVMGYGAVLAWDAGAVLRDLRALNDGMDSDRTELVDTLGSLDLHTTRMVSDLSPLLQGTTLFRHLPVVGPLLRALPETAAAGSSGLHLVSISAAASRQPLSLLLAGETSPQQALVPICRAIAADSRNVQGAADSFASHCDRLARIKLTLLPRRLRAGATDLQAALSLASAAARALPRAAGLLSSSSDQDVLVLIQNSDELRATGGFISSMAALQIRDDELAGLEFVDNYALEDWDQPHPDAPAPLRQEMGIDLLVTRDANWWPDLATSATTIASLYELNTGVPVHMVAAVDTQAAIRLVDIMTPLQLADGTLLEQGEIRSALAASWSLADDALLIDAPEIVASHAYDAIRIELVVSNRSGEIWFDDLGLYWGEQPANNLISNGSFELDSDANGQADHWKANDLEPLDGLRATQARTGSHSLYMAGRLGSALSAEQTIALQGAPGDTFRAEGYSKALNASLADEPYAMIISFLHEGVVVQREALSFPPWTHDWAMAGSTRVIANWWEHRKDIISDTFEALTSELADPASIPWLALAGETEFLLQERHIQLYASNELQELFAQQGWDGALDSSAGDLIAVVDSNVGYNKVNASISQTIAYDVNLETGLANVTLTYTNHSLPADGPCDKFRQYLPIYENLTQGCYWDYVRLYAPARTQWVATQGSDTPVSQTEADGLTEFALSILVKPAETRTVVLTYMLPESVLGSPYELQVRKQAGTDAVPLSVTITASGRLRSDEPEAVSSPDGLRWETDLLTDRQIIVSRTR